MNSIKIKLIYYFLLNRSDKNRGFTNIFFLILFFLLIGFVSFLVEAILFPSVRSVSCGCDEPEAKQNISSVNKMQSLMVTERGEFVDNFDALALGNLLGGNIDSESSKYYTYIITATEDLALIQAIPKKEDFKAFMGGVRIFKDSNDQLNTREVICRVNKPGKVIDPALINFEVEDSASQCPEGSEGY